MKKRLIVAICMCLCLCILLCACGDGDSRVVLTVGEFEVTADTYRYFYLNYGMELAEASDWIVKRAHIEDKVRSYAETAICDLYTIYALAQEHGVSLTDSRKAQMEAAFAEIVVYLGGEDAFDDGCKDDYMNRELFRMLYLESAYLHDDLYEHLIAESFSAGWEIAKTDLGSNFYRCRQIALYFEDMPKEDARVLMEELLEKVGSGKKTLAELALDAGGTYYIKGYAPVAFEEAALALQVGERSGIVESDVGFHIIERMPMETSFSETRLQELRELYYRRCMTEKMEECSSKLALKRGDKHDDVLAELGKELDEEISDAAKAAKEG